MDHQDAYRHTRQLLRRRYDRVVRMFGSASIEFEPLMRLLEQLTLSQLAYRQSERFEAADLAEVSPEPEVFIELLIRLRLIKPVKRHPSTYQVVDRTIRDTLGLHTAAQTLQSDDPQPALRAIIARCREHPLAIQLLPMALQLPEQYALQVAIIETFGSSTEPHVIPLLLGLLDGPAPLQQAAISQLRYHAGEAVVNGLVGQLPHPDPNTRKLVLQSLQVIADPSTLEAITPLLEDVEDDVGRVAARTLTSFAAQGEARLLHALHHPEAKVRWYAADALDQFDTPATLAGLRAALADPDVEVRQMAARSLFYSGATAALPTLLEVLPQADEALASTILDILDQCELANLEPRLALALLDAMSRCIADPAMSVALRLQALQTLAAYQQVSIYVDHVLVLLASLDQAEQITLIEALDDNFLEQSLRLLAYLWDWATSATIDVRHAALIKLAGFYGDREELNPALAEQLLLTMRDGALMVFADQEIKRGELFDSLVDMVSWAQPPDEGLTRLCEGLSEFADARHSAALDFIQQAIELQPDRWYHHYWFAELQSSWIGRQHDLALTHIDQAIALRPTIAFCYTQRGKILRALGQLEQAQQTLEQAIGLGDQWGYPYFIIGQTLYDQAHYQAACERFEQACQRTADPSYFNWLGYSYARIGAYQRALDTFDQAERLRDQPSADDIAGRGFTYYQQGEYPHALAHYRQIDSWSNMGDLYELYGLYDRAIAAYQQICEVDPHDPWPYHSIAMCYFHLQQYHHARPALDQAIQREPTNSVHYYWRSLVALAQADLEQAQIDLEQELQYEQTEPISWYYNQFWRGILAYVQNPANPPAYQPLQQQLSVLPHYDQARLRALLAAIAGDRAEAEYQLGLIRQQKPFWHHYVASRIYYTLLIRLFPQRQDLAELWQWFQGQFLPLPSLAQPAEHQHQPRLLHPGESPQHRSGMGRFGSGNATAAGPTHPETAEISRMTFVVESRASLRPIRDRSASRS